MTTPPVLILENGAYSIKAGFAGLDEEPRVFHNSIARSRVEKRVYVADEIEQCKDLSGLAYRRPFEKGMLVSWDCEKIIWDRIFSPQVMDVNTTETSLLMTEPYFNLPNIAETYDQMVFEEWEFASYFRATPAALIPYGGLFGDEIIPECLVLVDVGYSYTHVIPMRDGQVVWDHVKRANPRKNAIVQEYILPDFSPNSVSRTGYIRSGPGAALADESNGTNGHSSKNQEEDEQVLYMGNERFSGPELLFNPSDIGLKQCGLSEAIAHVIAQMPEEFQGLFWANIGVFGGLGNIEAFGERLEQDLRALCPIHYEIGIYEAFDPASPPYTSALALSASEIYLSTYPVTRAEYLEHGSSICRRRFGGPAYNVNPPGFYGGVGDDISDDEQERRYAMGLESKKGKKGKKGREDEEEVISGNWGGRRRRAGRA